MKFSFLSIVSGCLLLITACITGCEPPVSPMNDHTGYLDSLFSEDKPPIADSAKVYRLTDSAYNALPDPTPGDLWTKYYFRFAYYYFTAKNYDRAIAYADSMASAVNKPGVEKYYPEKYAKALFYRGDVLLTQRKFEASFGWYYKAREIIYKLNDPCILPEYSNRLAAATFRQERYIESVEFYKLAFNDYEKCDQETMHKFGEAQGCLDNIGIAYVKAGLYDSADVYFNKALAYIDKNGKQFPERADFMPVAKAVIYGNQANVAIRKHNLPLAEKLLKESIRINSMPDHPDEDAGYSTMKLAKIYLDQHRLPEAAEQLTRLATLHAKYTHNTDLTKNLYLLRSKFANAQGNNSEAYDYLLRYQTFVDSVAELNAPFAAADMQQTVNSISREYQLDILAKDNKRKSDYLWLSIVIVSMAIIIVGLVWANYRRYKQNVVNLVNLNNAITSKNQALLQTLGALEESHSNNTRLLKVVAHDLRGPLGAITSIAELGSDGMVPAEKYEEIMAIIYRSGTKALTLANHLLVDMQTIGKLVHPEPLNIAEKLRSCVELYEHKMKEKDQTVILETIPAFVNGEREKLWRVFSNLISNAVKFSRIGGEIKITMTAENDKLITAIHDNGIGIPEDLKDRIFEPTEATTRAGTIGERSFGLGLSISRNIIALHDGDLWFESNESDGTTFYVSLPLLHLEPNGKPA